MWAILLVGAFVTIGLRRERSASSELRAAGVCIVVVLAYVLVSNRLW